MPANVKTRMVVEDFSIERNNRIYQVRVQEQRNVEGKPLQITVTA